jgi:1,5-anhydro-D-fructose reductase (1,5-anhydro-D-mannitol-forming)
VSDPVRLRWGLIGSHGFADAVFAPVLRNAGQDLLGAAGSTEEGSAAFAERHGAPRIYASLDALLHDPDVDIVWVASPNHLHGEHIRRALEAGKHVLAEKPLATTGQDAHDLADLAERRGLRLGVGYQGRFHPALRDLHARVAEGALGNIAFVRASWQTQYAGLPDAWRLDPETSGGWAIMDIGTHTLDAALWLTGFPEARLLGSRLSTQHWKVDVEDLAVLLLQLGAATGVVETATGVQGPANRVEVHGTNGWAIATGVFVPRLGASGGRLILSDGTRTLYDAGQNPYEAQAEAFAGWVVGRPYTGATGAEGAVNIALLEEARDGMGAGSESSLRQKAAVDRQRLARDEGRLLRAEPDDRLGDLGG